MNKKEWLIDWFSRTASVEKESVMANMDSNYFEVGYLDSFGFLNLIVDIQESFGITLENEDFVEGRANTINDLAKLIEDRTA